MLDNSGLSQPRLPRTVEELAALDWKTFEAFATQTIRNYYARFNVEILPTPFNHDGGRDGEGAYVLATSENHPDLTITYRIRLEVKKRSANVTLDDIGKNLVIASNDAVQKLVVVTNRSFAPQVEREIERFASRHAMSYGLVTGEKLLALAHDHTAASELPLSVGKEAKLDIEISFSRQPHPIDAKQVADLIVQPDEPIFLIANICRTDAGPAAEFMIDITGGVQGVSAIRYSAPQAIALAGGEHARVVFTIARTTESPHGVPFNIAVRTSTGDVQTSLKWNGRYRVGSTLLSRWIPESRWSRLQEWTMQIHDWIRGGGRLSLGLIAYPGVGKSVMLNRLRAVWLAAGVRELYLEGGRRTTDADIATLLFEAAFPVTPSLLRGPMLAAVERWLIDCDMNRGDANEIAQSLCSGGFIPAAWKSDRLADLCASLLRRIAAKGRAILVVEDLHFYEPSAIELLTRIQVVLRTLADSHVAFLCTSRQFAVSGDSALRAEWSKHLDDFFSKTDVKKEHLEAFTENEAADILLRTIPTIESHLARVIINQVGCAPLALREAVAFFRTQNIIWHDSALNALVSDRDRLVATVKSNDLTRATNLRLTALRQQFPSWLAALLDAAACVGRFFRIEEVLPDGWSWTAEQQSALDFCEELDVIRPYEEGLWAFDHDLIRTAAVEMMSRARQQLVAGSIVDRPVFLDRPLLRGSLLYQAGRYGAAAEALEFAGRDAMHRHRYRDATKSLLLAVTCIDPATSGRSGSLDGFDVAISHAQQPRRKAPPTEATRSHLLELMTLLLRSTGAAVYASERAATYLTEAIMLARQLRDNGRLAELVMIQGIRAFERDELPESIRAHEEADKLLEQVGAASLERAENLLRLAITQRQQNEMQEALATIRRAHRLVRATNRDLLIRLALNAGAVYLNNDLNRVAKYWHLGLKLARQTGDVDRLVHGMVDVGYLELLRGNDELAASLLSEGHELAINHELENSAMRAASNLACLHLIRGDVMRALDLLAYAEEVGVRLEIGRRLWRIRANLATAHEANGDLDRTYAIDSQLVVTLARPDKVFREGRRQSIPLLNIALRAAQSKVHRELLDSLQPVIRESVLKTLERVESNESADVYPGLRCALRKISGRRRFIVTE